MHSPEEILEFWFGDIEEGVPIQQKRWFSKDPEFDRLIREKFYKELDAAARGQLAEWEETPRGRLALILVLDQFSRNAYRGQPRSFAQDPMALRVCLRGLEAEDDRQLERHERGFFYLPLMHAEDRDIQRRSVAMYKMLLDEAPHREREEAAMVVRGAERHAEIIERFGRYPHRNEVLGRTPRPGEVEFLQEPGSSF